MIGVSLGIGSSQKPAEIEAEIESRVWEVEWLGDLSSLTFADRLRRVGGWILGKLKRERESRIKI